MSVAFEVVEAPYPYVCAVYTCRCGAATTQHGEQAAIVPAGWRLEGLAGDETHVACPRCAEPARAMHARA
jgi:hypothetical protein